MYARRGEAEDAFNKALRRGLIPVVFGEYGVGKTSMARYSLLDADKQGLLVNIESAANKSLSDVFQRCLEKLGYAVQVRRTRGATNSTVHEQSGQAEAGISFFKAIIASKRTKASDKSEHVEEEFAVTSPTDSRLIEICEAAGLVLLIDELHRATPEFAEELAMFIKSYGNANGRRFRIVLLGTSSDATRLVRSDPGIDRLLQEVRLGAMNAEEAAYVVEKGMEELGISISPTSTDRLVRSSVGSPSILQYLCLEAAEKGFDRTPRIVHPHDVTAALTEYVDKKEARLYRMYMAGIETVGELRYRKQILRAMAEIDDEYATMEDIRERVSQYLGRDAPSTALSGPLRDLKEPKYGPLLSDVPRPDGAGRVLNYTTFVDPALKAFIRMQVVRESEVE